jgi:type I restriction enzyme R subunit
MVSTPDHESEQQTRRKRIDPLLQQHGWTVEAFDPDRPLDRYEAHALAEFPTANGPADYALVVRGKVLGIVEAKKVSLGPQGVLTQAERYAKGVTGTPFNFNGYRVPFLYSTNGVDIWFQDARNELNVARKIAGFHTPAALQEMLSRDFDGACDWFEENPNEHHRLRPYQIDANTAIEDAIAKRKRQMLVAMATGTGKTFTLVNQVYRLMKSELGLRILFLVDRRALAAQAVRAFASFEPEPNKKFDKIYEVYSQRFQREDIGEDDRFDPKVLPASYLKTPEPKHAFVYVCTIQRMAINLFGREAVWSGEGDDIEDDADRIDIPIHAFDVIIADECHRGYTTQELSLWRNTLDHFDAIKIGLTATPAAHTKAYFRDVVYRYEYSRAVREGFLVDYDVVSIKSDVRMKGVFLKEADHVELVDPETGVETLDQLEDERAFESDEVERRVTSPDSNRKILEEVKKYALEHEETTGRFPKTLIFAANDLPHTSHADQLVELAVDLFGKGQSFVRKITGRVDRPLQAIREFRNRPNPGVAVTVDLLSTGVDIPDLEFIVFLRPVKSRILFEQMLGRGTRKGEKYPDKSHFTVFDCFDGTLIQYFREATAITAEPPMKPTRTIREIIDDIWANRDRDYNVRCLVRRLQRIDKEMAPEARELFEARGIPDGDVRRFAAELPARLRRDFKGTMELLRDEALQDLLMDYPRRKLTFVKAFEYEDTVSSEWLVRDGRGREMKPEDYLAAFSRFVRENPAHVEAIQILLDRPKGWGTDALKELKAKLSATPERFTIENLQKAHRVRYEKAMADIISMVKHAVRKGEPLLTAEERVEQAFRRVSFGKTLTQEQRDWLNRIREHMIVNLSIDRGDFDLAPVLSRAGGWAPADRTFGGRLKPLMDSLNEAIAA